MNETDNPPEVIKHKPLKVVFLFGPTGVGKTELIKKLANHPLIKSPPEIINADSLQVYRYLDVGTAKPAKEFLNALPHHLIDVRTPDEQFNVGEFIRLTDEIAQQITGRHHWPLVSGGTAFYIKHFLFGLPLAPPSDPDVRENLEMRAQNAGLTGLFQELKQVDPVYAQKISAADRTRIIRALEVYEISGRPLSSFELPTQPRPGLSFLLIGLVRPRPELNLRIEKRVEEMFEQGLVSEIRDLLKRGYKWSDPGLQGIGYKEFFIMQQGCFTFRDLKELIIKHTKAYAKRQMTFFRSLSEVHWFHPDDFERIVGRILEFLLNPPLDYNSF